MMSQMINDEEFNRPLNPSLASQPPQRRWSLSTLMAARPNPRHDTRARAEAWNNQYRDIPQLLVDPADFPTNHPEPSAEQVERNWERLGKLTEDFNKNY